MNYGINQQYPPQQLPPGGVSNMGSQMTSTPNLNNPSLVQQGSNYGSGQLPKTPFTNNIPLNSQLNGPGSISQHYSQSSHQPNSTPTQQQNAQQNPSTILPPPPGSLKQPNLENNNVITSNQPQTLQNGQQGNYYNNLNTMGQPTNAPSSQLHQNIATRPNQNIMTGQHIQQLNTSKVSQPGSLPPTQSTHQNSMIPPSSQQQFINSNQQQVYQQNTRPQLPPQTSLPPMSLPQSTPNTGMPSNSQPIHQMAQPGMPSLSQAGMPPKPQGSTSSIPQPMLQPMPQSNVPLMNQQGGAIPAPLQSPMQPILPPGVSPMSFQQGMSQQYQNTNMINQQQPYLNQQQLPNQGSMTYPSGPGMPPPGMQQRGQMGQIGRPGQQPQYNMFPQQMAQQQPQQQRRLDPDQMPNPIQVMSENQKTSGGIFATNNAGMLPPLVTTKFITQDQGNSSPRFIRSSIYYVPATSEILKATSLPFTLILSPFANAVENEMSPPIVDFGELGPVRCIRCKAYMSPNMQFIDAGRRFQCVLCKATTEVPSEYFQHLDHTGQRLDKYERPELVLGTYEFVATKDYCRENTFPNPPAYIFVIDVSYNNVKNGLVKLLCNEIKAILKHLPVDEGHEKSKIKVGFITYNSVVHFYNIKSTLTQPQMMIVGDAKEMFMPLLDGFLCDPEESSLQIDSLLEKISTMFENTKETECILYPAVQAGIEALKASKCPGKLFVFQSSLPISDVPGKLKNRDDRKLLGTEKEKSVLSAQNTAYAELARDAVQVGCSIDLFIFNNSYIDLATIGQLSRFTGGEVYKYTYFQADIDGQRLIKDLVHNISRATAFDAVMRVRTSTGVRPTEFYGHYFMTNTTDLELASIDAEKSIAIEIKHDDKLPPDENVYIQVALLYTSCSGQRRLRINNVALRTTTTIADVFKACDLDATILFLAKQSIIKLLEHSPKIVKDHLIQVSAQILACYRKHCTSPTSAGQLILPECLKLLPLYISCMLKNDAISGGSDMTCDDRSYVMQHVLSFDLPASTAFFYPRLMPIHNINIEDKNLPSPIRCSYEKMSPDGAYILENGMYLFIWLGNMLSPEFLKDLFGVQTIHEVSQERLGFRNDTELSLRIWQVIDEIMNERKKSMKITIIKQQDKLETVYRHFLVEDHGCDGTLSYVDFLCHMHKEIKELLN
ncbi:protein transport protein Sec24C [Condylostylus longicornis]|uniref:protein transport protein Sec24C n=1 Tax=Condylostylus longicornis TaxID=2530218 RepID=UPI00244E32F0|nr:protein transport protein Sec24C [Condylostylus longicornis]